MTVAPSGQDPQLAVGNHLPYDPAAQLALVTAAIGKISTHLAAMPGPNEAPEVRLQHIREAVGLTDGLLLDTLGLRVELGVAADDERLLLPTPCFTDISQEKTVLLRARDHEAPLTRPGERAEFIGTAMAVTKQVQARERGGRAGRRQAELVAATAANDAKKVPLPVMRAGKITL